MPDIEEMTPGQILADTNVATFLSELGLGIARAQTALDENSLNTAVALATTRPEFSNRSLLDLGFSPAFYHYQHADLEVSLQITMRVERSTSVRVGLNFGINHSTGSSNQGDGEARITVNFGGGAPALAAVRLAEAGPGVLTVGATTVNLLSGAAVSPNVSVVANSLSRTARALADRMSDPPEAVPEVLLATVELVEGGTALTATTNSPTAFDVGQPNRIVVLDRAARPARAWLSITGPGNASFNGSDTATWAAAPSAVEAASTAIDALTALDANVLFKGRTAAEPFHVNFALDKADVFQPSNDLDVLEPLIDFLKDNNSIAVEVVGHCDATGNERRNDPLSLQRAQTVHAYLLRRGVSATQLAAAPVGRGERELLVNVQTAEVRNRRVEVRLLGAVTDVVAVRSAAPGASATWDTGRPTVAAGGSVLSATNGSNAVPLGSGAKVTLSGHDFVANGATTSATEHPFVPGASAASAASALAQVILTEAHIDAVAEGPVVRLLPLGSHALIRLQSQGRNAAANSLTLNATGSLSREAPFAGASAGGEPAAGDTVTIGATVLTCTTDASPTTRQFAKGTDAATTATNLAAAVGRVSGMQGTAAAAVVTVRGLSGTRLATSNPQAFELSAATLSGEAPTPQRTESNTTVAAGLSVDVAYARRFGMEVTGNSRIAARLVSLPAPVELLDEIRTFLGPNPSASPAPAPTPAPAPAPTPGG
ncbi:outer membrane protein/peptidoglycan-associated (lipo)protein [Burkholderiales bacterium JOSHI_001]|nr:outer membrane protein/peptidoglycan-associated (lipo)protein [Burkholderiales bacterium JOSHI_001]